VTKRSLIYNSKIKELAVKEFSKERQSQIRTLNDHTKIPDRDIRYIIAQATKKGPDKSYAKTSQQKESTLDSQSNSSTKKTSKSIQAAQEEGLSD